MKALLLTALFCVSALAATLPHCRLPLMWAGEVVVPGYDQSFQRSEFLLRRTKVDGKRFHEALVVEEYDTGGDYTTTVIRREVRSGYPAGREGIYAKELKDLEEDPAATFLHQGLIRPIMAENLKSYKDRRAWSPEFRRFLAQAAGEYLNDSTYVAVTHKKTGKIAGGVRFIVSPYGIRDGQVVAEGPTVEKWYGPVKGFREEGEVIGPQGLPRPPRVLPEETSLNIAVGNPAVKVSPGSLLSGVNIEMGALFVDKSLSKTDHDIVWGEIWLQTLKMAHHSGDDGMNFYGTTIHAYADASSKRLYLPLGFELARSYVKDGKLVTYGPEEEIPPIVKPDGSKWWPIVYRPEKINEFVVDWANGKYPNRGGAHVRDRLNALADSRDGEPLSVSIAQVKALVDSLVRDKEDVAEGAGQALNRLIQMQAIHFSKMNDTTLDGETRERAKRSAAAIEESLSQLEMRIPEVLQARRRHARFGLASFARHLAETKDSRHTLQPPFILDKLLIPLLGDSDLMVRLSAVHELRNAFFDRVKLREYLGIASNPEGARVTAIATLKASGVSEGEIEKVSNQIRDLLGSSLLRGNPDKDEVYYQNSTPVDIVAIELMPYLGDTPTIRNFLVLASLDN